MTRLQRQWLALPLPVGHARVRSSMVMSVQDRRTIRCLFLLVLLAGTTAHGAAFSQEALTESPLPVKKVDLLLSGHVIGLFPQDKGFSVGGNQIPNTDMRGTIGAGVKFDIYPWFTKKIVGAEIEAFGLGGSVRAPRTTSGTGTTQAQGSLIAITTMYNLMLRYPGETVQPYLGVGAGSSTGILYNANIQSGNVSLAGTSGISRLPTNF